jgi:hypothetical protein
MSTVQTKKNTYAATEALWRIAETNDTHHLASILADGADINASNTHGMTALMRAASQGHIRMVRVLLMHGADPNVSRNDKFTPLMLAAFFGHDEVVRVLVEHGADTGAATRFGTSAQMWAASRTFGDVVHYLDEPRTARSVSKEPAAEYGRTQAQTEGKVPLVSGEGIVNLTTPAVALESSVKKDGGVQQEEPSTLAGTDKTTNELLEVQEEIRGFALRPRFIRRFQPRNRRMVIYSATPLLVVFAVIAGLTWRMQRHLNEMSSQTHRTVAVDTTRAAENMRQAKTTAPSNAPVYTLGESNSGNDANDANYRYRRPENGTEGNKSKQPLIARSVISNSNSRTGKPSEEQNREANVNTPTPIPADGSEDVPNRKLPSVAAVGVSPAKPQPVSRVATPVSRVAAPRNGPAPLTTQLISPSKSSPPKGRPIQWP